MSFSLSGEQFPELVVPSRLPKSSSEKIVLLMVRGRLGSGSEVRLSQRFLTTILSRSGNEAIGRRLNGLVSAGFLIVVRRSSEGTVCRSSGGTVYGKGKLLESIRVDCCRGFETLPFGCFCAGVEALSETVAFFDNNKYCYQKAGKLWCYRG